MFTEEEKRIYESIPLSFVYYQNVDGKAVPVLVSQGFCQNTGMEPDKVLEWLSSGMFERMHPDDVGLVSKVSDDFLCHKGPYDIIFRCRLGEGYVYIHGLGKWQVMADGTELAVIGYVNVSETMKLIHGMEESYNLLQKDRFYNDSVTGLPNINYFNEFADERVSVMRLEGEKPLVVYFDVNSMQSYNTQYGVAEGDNLLRLVGRCLKEEFAGCLLIRAANDHFIVVATEENLTQKIERANEKIRKSAKGNTTGFRAGICPVRGAISEALDHARHALRRIDNDMTRIWAIFSQAADDQYWRERYIVENLEEALRSNQIKAYYQRIVAAQTEKVICCEALARWIDPVRGIISPAEFIPVLQKYHLLHKLDLYILEQVFMSMSTWHERGFKVMPVSVNFSRQDFDHVDVVDAMNRLYDQYGIGSFLGKESIIVEITEQDMARGEERFREQLRNIRESGYQLWLDDFGSGYSALNMLSQFKFDMVKMDMALIQNLDENGGINRLILKEMAVITKKIGVPTLVEGVENMEQLEFVQEIGCDLVQGYYYSRPEPLEALLLWRQNLD